MIRIHIKGTFERCRGRDHRSFTVSIHATGLCLGTSAGFGSTLEEALSAAREDFKLRIARRNEPGLGPFRWSASDVAAFARAYANDHRACMACKYGADGLRRHRCGRKAT